MEISLFSSVLYENALLVYFPKKLEELTSDRYSVSGGAICYSQKASSNIRDFMTIMIPNYDPLKKAGKREAGKVAIDRDYSQGFKRKSTKKIVVFFLFSVYVAGICLLWLMGLKILAGILMLIVLSIATLGYFASKIQ